MVTAIAATVCCTPKLWALETQNSDESCPEFGIDDVVVQIDGATPERTLVLRVPRKRFAFKEERTKFVRTTSLLIIGGEKSKEDESIRSTIYNIDDISKYSVGIRIGEEFSIESQSRRMMEIPGYTPVPIKLNRNDRNYVEGLEGYNFSRIHRLVYIKKNSGELSDVITCGSMDNVRPSCLHNLYYRGLYLDVSIAAQSLENWDRNRRWSLNFLECALKKQ